MLINKGMMNKLVITILLFLISGITQAQNIEIVNSSDAELISQKHFDKCITRSNFSLLLDKRTNKNNKEKVYFSCIPAIQNKDNCDGIYYYKYLSSSFKQPKYIDNDGNRYYRYSIFIINDGKLIPITSKSKRARKNFYKKNREVLIDAFGESEVLELEQDILNGYKNI